MTVLSRLLENYFELVKVRLFPVATSTLLVRNYFQGDSNVVKREVRENQI